MRMNAIGGGVVLLALVACGGDADVPPPGPPASPGVPAAGAPATPTETGRAVFRNQQGTEIGTATITPEGNGVRIAYDLAFLESGERGFHVHAVGSCEGPTFDSAGPHFNPTERAHGFDHPDGPHAGDLRNLDVDTDEGTARGSEVNEFLTLARGQPNSLFDADGSSLVVHAGRDDYVSQPSGDSGARVACAVIEPA
jgi:superoxide dismutase, Cu-Zn family